MNIKRIEGIEKWQLALELNGKGNVGKLTLNDEP